MRRLLASVLLVPFAVAACSGGGSDLAKSDPKGALACSSLAQAFKDKDSQDKAIAGVVAAGTAAKDATTPAIKASYIDLAGTDGADAQKLHDACVAAGVSMPDVPAS